MLDYDLSQRLMQVKQKKREIERKRKQNRIKNAPGFHFIRIPCSVRFEHQFGEDSDFFPTSLFLHETDDKKLKMFSSVSLNSRQSVEVYLPLLGNLLIPGEVQWCELFTLSPKIYHQNPLYYRSELKLKFNSEEERIKFKSYLENLKKQHSLGVKTA